MVDETKNYLTLEEVADRLGVHYQLIYRLVRDGELPAIRLGRVYRVETTDLEAFLQASKTARVRSPGAEPPAACSACGKVYKSRQSLTQECEECSSPICADCWSRRKVRKCKEHGGGGGGG